MSARYQRPSKRYDGVHSTVRPIADFLPQVLSQMTKAYADCPELILQAWPDVIGQKLAPMTRAVSFIEGVLLVHVNNSTLHSLLCQQDKAKVLHALRERFPSVTINNIHFRIA